MSLHQGKEEELLPLPVKGRVCEEGSDIPRKSLVGGTVELLIVPVVSHPRQDLPVVEGAFPVEELRQVLLQIAPLLIEKREVPIPLQLRAEGAVLLF